MQLAIYAHPFDLAALPDGGLARLRDLGFAELALATSYHDGRWLQPWQPRTRVRFLEDGTVHFRPRGAFGALRPQPSSEVPGDGPSPLEALCAAAPRAGLAVRAWNVFTHNSRLGLGHRALCVENAWGDRYPYALCPAQPEVQAYELGLVRELAAHAGLGAIEFEAFGQMGWKHSSHHDKASFTPGGLLDAALSACCCSACRAVMAANGADPEVVRRAIVAFGDARLRDGDAMAPASGGDERDAAAWLPPVLAARRQTIAALAAKAVASAPLRRAIQVHPNPWFTGSQLAAASAAAFPAADERVLTCYGEGPDAIGKTLAAHAAVAVPTAPLRLSIWPKVPQFTGDEDLVKVRDLCRAHGVGTLAIYHLGLLPWRTIERVAKMVTA